MYVVGVLFCFCMHIHALVIVINNIFLITIFYLLITFSYMYNNIRLFPLFLVKFVVILLNVHVIYLL